MANNRDYEKSLQAILNMRKHRINPLLEADDDEGGGSGLPSPFDDSYWEIKPPASGAEQQAIYDLQHRVASMQADALAAMYSTLAEQPRTKNVAMQQAEMGLGMGHGGGNGHMKSHPLTSTSVYFSGDGSTVNADAQVNETAADEYNKKLEHDRKHKANLQYSTAPKPGMSR